VGPAFWLQQHALFFATSEGPPEGMGFGLGAVYAIWMALAAALYLPCARFGDDKRAHPERTWLRYL
jgi:hypothetical protein